MSKKNFFGKEVDLFFAIGIAYFCEGDHVRASARY
jgi:hypothetical protein